MHIIGIDLGKRNSQLCVGDAEGKVIKQVRVPTSRDELGAALAAFHPAQVLVEASTSSEWVARHLEELGHNVVVGDPRFGPMYARLDKAVKTDKRDAAALYHARRLGAYRSVHRRSDENRRLRKSLGARALLVRMRGKLVVQIRAFCEEEGIKLRTCGVENFVDALGEITIDAELGMLLLPLLSSITALSKEIDALDTQLERTARENPVVRRFDDVVGVGPVTAVAVVACIGDVSRFRSSREVAAYLGLVPREYSSGEGRRLGGLTKAGDSLTRSYLVQAAWRLLRSKSEAAAPLREWAERVALRRGRKRAVVGLARRLIRILFAMWRDDSAFDVARLKGG